MLHAGDVAGQARRAWRQLEHALDSMSTNDRVDHRDLRLMQHRSPGARETLGDVALGDMSG